MACKSTFTLLLLLLICYYESLNKFPIIVIFEIASMSIFVSYLIIPLVLLLLGVNLYFRFKIIKQYKVLKARRVQVDQLHVFNKEKRLQLSNGMSSEDAKLFESFVGNIDKLIRFVIAGFMVILLFFIYLYINSPR